MGAKIQSIRIVVAHIGLPQPHLVPREGSHQG